MTPKVKVNKIRKSKKDYMMHKIFGYKSNTVAMAVVILVLALNIAGVGAQPSTSPTGGDVNARFSSLSVNGTLDVNGSIYNSNGDTVRINDNLRLGDNSVLELGQNGKIKNPASGMMVEIEDVNGILLDGPVTIEDDPLTVQGNVVIQNGSNLVMTSGSKIRNNDPGGVVEIEDSDGILLDGEVTIEGDNLNLQGSSSIYDSTDNTISILENLEATGNITSTNGKIGSLLLLQTFDSSFQSRPENVKHALSLACPAGTVLISCTGGINEASNSALTHPGYFGSQLFPASNTCRSYAAPKTSSPADVHYTMATCFDPTGQRSGTQTVSPL